MNTWLEMILDVLQLEIESRVAKKSADSLEHNKREISLQVAKPAEVNAPMPSPAPTHERTK